MQTTYRIHIRNPMKFREEGYYAVQWLRGIGIRFEPKDHVVVHPHTHLYVDWHIPGQLDLAQQKMFELLFYAQTVELIKDAA